VQTLELLASSLALSARSPAFPELVHLPTLALKRFAKASPVERFRSQARMLLDAVAANARLVGLERDNANFAPKDADAVAAFLRCGGLACALLDLRSNKR
jgi:nucleolar complex protein 2